MGLPLLLESVFTYFVLERASPISSKMVSETDSVPEKHDEKRDSAGLVIGAHQVHTNEVVPGHANYYEKDGLRTYGDDEDHDHEPPLTLSRFMRYRKSQVHYAELS